MEKDKTLLIVFGTMAILFAIWFFLGGTKAEHIEDTNGPDDYSLAVITEEDIFAKGVKTAKGGPKTKTSKGQLFGLSVSSGTTYFAEKFSGQYIIEEWNFWGKSDLVFNIYNYEVAGGNFKMYFASEDKILETIEPGAEIYFEKYDLEPGYYQLIIVGESAEFSFTSFDFDEE